MKKTHILMISIASVLLVAVLVYAFDPFNIFGRMRDKNRKAEIVKIGEAVVKYANANGGRVPKGIRFSDSCKDSENKICKKGVDCGGFSSDDLFTGGGLVVLSDDSFNKDKNTYGYNISRDDNGRVKICAPYAETGDLFVVY